jgi:hypothetical protein
VSAIVDVFTRKIKTMLVSTFELLVKSQLPKEFPAPPPFDKLGRTAIQGYFLTIANVSNNDAIVSLTFTSVTPALDANTTVTFLDIKGNNQVGDIVLDASNPGKATFNNIPLPANDTCLFILQPDILKDGGQLLKDANFEVRGYVEIGLISPRSEGRTRVLLVPEHRGTFFNSKLVDNPGAEPQLDQFVCPLPLANNTALYELRREGEGR